MQEDRYWIRYLQYDPKTGRSEPWVERKATYELALTRKDALEAAGAAEVTITPIEPAERGEKQ